MKQKTRLASKYVPRPVCGPPFWQDAEVLGIANQRLFSQVGRGEASVCPGSLAKAG